MSQLIRTVFVAGVVCCISGRSYSQDAPVPSAETKPAAVSAPDPQNPSLRMPIQQVATLGDGPIPMVLVPDVGYDCTIWKSFMERNAHRYTMYAVTLPGFGGTHAPELKPGELWDSLVLTKNAVAALVKFIDDQGLVRPVVMGHGYGGHLAMKLAIEHPMKTRAVISVDGLPVQPLADPNQDDSFSERHALIRDSIAPKMIQMSDEEWHNRHFMSTMSVVSDDFKARDYAVLLSKQDRGVHMMYLFETLMSDVRPGLKTIQVPLLCIAPVSPDPNPPREIFHMAWYDSLGAPPGAWLTFYPDCRHFVMDDNPDQLDFDVDLFIRGKDIPGARRSTEPIPHIEIPASERIPKYTPPGQPR